MRKTNIDFKWIFIPALSLTICIQQLNAQRMRHGASRSVGRQGGIQRPAGGGNNRSINGGSIKSPDRPVANNSSSRNIGNKTNIDNSNVRKNNNNTRNSNNTNISGNTVNVNVVRSRDINVVNNRNTVVRRNN